VEIVGWATLIVLVLIAIYVVRLSIWLGELSQQVLLASEYRRCAYIVGVDVDDLRRRVGGNGRNQTAVGCCLTSSSNSPVT